MGTKSPLASPQKVPSLSGAQDAHCVRTHLDAKRSRLSLEPLPQALLVAVPSKKAGLSPVSCPSHALPGTINFLFLSILISLYCCVQLPSVMFNGLFRASCSQGRLEVSFTLNV